MLVNYMQLLGLLRLVRINWAEQLSSMLTYLDFTSGATTWVSVECSMSDTGSVPRSAKRSVVVLLWPCKWTCELSCKGEGVFVITDGDQCRSAALCPKTTHSPHHLIPSSAHGWQANRLQKLVAQGPCMM